MKTLTRKTKLPLKKKIVKKFITWSSLKNKRINSLN